ncbi:ATP-dependent helicase [Rhodococcus triatomae]|uniref:DNA 3'-5' helicase n=1 Tax=Rhodococcus triatomae TaxID=300028 RepID=A0A1G8F4S7_9NOCA|nr:ATP-dependent DNA helicase [Rhodococcus triatomae]QNG19388.1 ATP-dependent helicase [Rhodococcus triatomae]QNG24699.1 ATP-dependent helicase [Rhodococcus triatomae]SDH77131.1 DNA helicase-2 / ATP-dependent DNA helicase PcrA [Rhodococcus triatomae]
MSTGAFEPRIDPVELAAGLGQHPPTPEQAAVIAAPLRPTLVVAGAGAGKTETMAARVVWLVANGLVAPDALLGLTFTRKAAQQLTVRIRQRLARLAGSELLRSVDPGGELRSRILASEPEVSTYHAYAGRLLADHGLLLPIEPTATLLSETELWQIAHRVVSSWDGDIDTDRTPASLTEAVLALYGQLAEHLAGPEDLREAHTDLEKLVFALPPGPRQRREPGKSLLDVVEAQRRRIELLPLVARLTETLRREGALDFGSQMSLAARLADEHPGVGDSERQRFRVVLLDEYQDTGHSQRVLLSALFGGGADSALSVTAVGDPMQSIYGWRGASAANLPRFATDFPLADGTPAPTLELLTSWRNPPEALDLANHVSAPLRRSGVAVSTLRPRPGAEPGDVRLALLTDADRERQWVASAVAGEFERAREAAEPMPTAAVLVRRNADAAPMAEALRARGLPVEVVGLGGLLHTPEVADVVAMLRVVADPMAGSAAVRLLTGARWQIGAADLRALARRAGELEISRGYGTSGAVTDPESLAEALGSALPGEVAEQAGLADALADPGSRERYSQAGFARITALASELASLRERIGQPLTELVAEVERVLAVGVEVCARGGAAGREHLDAFADVVAGYAGRSTATLSGLLAFLAAAESVEDGLAPGEVQVDPDRVQILTVHSAKGLEWEVVAVPHVTAGVFPSGTASGTWLGALGELPPALRGDRVPPGAADGDGFPTLDLDDVADRKDLEQAIERHKAALAGRRREEDRRLFYVALTRTERVLLVSGHHWAETGTEPKGPSEFLVELHEHAARTPDCPVRVDEWAPPPDEGAENPLTSAPVTASWPPDPLGARREAVETGARLVRAALSAVTGADSGRARGTAEADDPENWAADVDALLRERQERSRVESEVVLPAQLSVSQLVELKADPDAFAARLRRPLPYPPNPLARRGTAFHAWVEARFGAVRLLDFDELPGAADTDDGSDDDLEGLQQAFLRSRWAHRTPVEVEVPFETAVGGAVLRGRIDAVFADPDGGWTVVDWKTGAPPSTPDEPAVVMQLAAYRLAWAELMGAPPEKVRAAFHYVRSGRTMAPGHLPGAEALAELVSGRGGPV